MTLSRRRFLAISAAACSFGTGAKAQARWQGRALGAPASMHLVGVSDRAAAPIFAAITAEIARLEQIFSLYQPQSELVRLNAIGRLANPAADLLQVLSLSDAVHRATDGAFDPTIQPLWRAYADALTSGQTPDLAGMDHDWAEVRFDTRNVTLQRPGMALTLNGIAQGYITDRVRTLLADQGLSDILIDCGEVAAIGARADGQPWQAGVRNMDGRIVQRVQLRDRALATSAAQGLVLNPADGTGHILHPRLQAVHSLVAISAPKAALADALSTAGILMSHDALVMAASAFAETEIAITQEKG